jgi:hypothetical protein
LERWSEAQRLVTRLRGEGALAADARTAVCGWRSGLTRTTESAALLDAVDAAFECRAGGGSGAEVRE